jgi:hypothetical protein
MVNPREHRSKLIGLHQPKDIPHPVGAGFDLPDHPLHPLGFSTLLFHPVEAPVAHHKQEQDTSPNRDGRNPGSFPSIAEGVDLLAKVEDLFDVATESFHHGRFLPWSGLFDLNCSFFTKNRFRQNSEICSIKCQAS